MYTYSVYKHCKFVSIKIWVVPTSNKNQIILIFLILYVTSNNNICKLNQLEIRN